MSIRVVTMNGEVKYQGDVGPRGADGKQGKDLEFNWRDTQLGVRQEGQTLYTYRDLKGEKGDKGEEYDDTEIRQELQNKVEKEQGKGLSSNDYTTEEKNKLTNLPENPLAEETDPTVPEHVKNITQEDINKWNNPIGTVESVNEKTGAVVLTAEDVGAIGNYNSTNIQIKYVWVGTETQYEALESIEENVEYNIIEE